MYLKWAPGDLHFGAYAAKCLLRQRLHRKTRTTDLLFHNASGFAGIQHNRGDHHSLVRGFAVLCLKSPGGFEAAWLLRSEDSGSFALNIVLT